MKRLINAIIAYLQDRSHRLDFLAEAQAEVIRKRACHHNWKVHSETGVYTTKQNIEDDHPAYTKQVLICTKCGEITHIKL